MNRSKITILVLVFVAILSFNINANAAGNLTEGSIDFNDTKIHLRPTEESPIVYQLGEGTRISVYAEEDGFLRIGFGNYRGYVKRENVFIAPEDTYEASIYTNGVRLRMNPGKYSNIITELDEGTKVVIIDIFNDWYRVVVNDSSIGDSVTGFVSKEYIIVNGSKKGNVILRPTMESTRVKTMQKELKKRGFLSAPTTAYYGPATKQAVGNFQKIANLSPDGIAGPVTLKILYGDNNIKAPKEPVFVVDKPSNASTGSSISTMYNRSGNWKLSTTASSRLSSLGQVSLSSWSSISKVWARYEKKSALVTDIQTGNQFRLTRYGGSNHADVTPDSKNDTEILKKSYGGSWSWGRRPIWVTVDGKTFAGSMNGMPHGIDFDPNDGMNGQICVHFYQSTGHSNPNQDKAHQDAVKTAYNYGNS